MVKGLHYEETFAPVVQWATIRFLISMAILNNWHTRQLDFVLAYTQADIERDLYMKLPAGFSVPGRTIQNKTERTMFSSWRRTCMDKSKQEGFGIYI